MVNYQKGKIYKIISDKTDKIYVGSTTIGLSKRFSNHKKKKDTTSVVILEYDDCRIILIEDYPCERKEQLVMREQYWIDHFKNIKVNKVKAFQSKEEKKEYKKQHKLDNKEQYNKVWDNYYEKNKETIKERASNFYHDNIEVEREKRRQYGRDNAESSRERAKTYYENNKETIKINNQRKYDCECGKTNLLITNKSKHIKSKQHISNLP